MQERFYSSETDMSKAYDQVEWPFVESILRKFGFAEEWITSVIGA